jgi:energy-coupling factor transporter ATP-binding protein EcfA2
MYPLERMWDHRNCEEMVKAKVHLPHDGIREFIVPTEALADTKALSKLFTRNGVIPGSQEKLTMLSGYMSNYIRELQKYFKATTNYAQLGWQDDSTKFVLPEVVIGEGGVVENCGVSTALRATAKNFHKKGTLEAWKETVNTYAKPEYEHYAFGHLVGFGSLLFNFTQYNGAIVNMMGGSGSGKTTVLHTINSIFGHPEDMLSIQVDTMISRMERVGIYNSISATYDEITDIPRDDLSALCYNISQGRGKDRADKSGNIRDNHTHWKMIMACTANKSMYDILGTGGFNMSGQSMRVFEFRIDPQKFMSLSESKRIFGKLFDNYGHAGEIFVKYVIEHKDEIKQRLHEMDVRFEEAAQISIPERYWSNIASCCIVAGEICRKLELNTFNIENVFQWAVNQLKSMRGSVVEAKYDSTGILTEFMNNHISSTLIVNGQGDKKTPFWVDANGEPRGSLMIRNEVDTNFAYISRSAIKQWITKNSGDYSAVKRDLMNAGILVNADMRKVLSANSNTTKTGQVDCWQVNVGHQAMSGVVLKVVESKEGASA